MSLFTSAKVEIEFTAGTWTDVSAYQTVAWNPIVVKGGRPTEFDPVSAGSVTLDLLNGDGRFTPDNASGAYYPNMEEGKRLRVSLVKGGVTYVLFTGFIQAILPSFQQHDVIHAISSITALDSLSMLSQRTMYGQAGEIAMALATANTTWCDYFLLTEQATGATIPVVTNSSAATISSAQIVPSRRATDLSLNMPYGPLSWTGKDPSLSADGVVTMSPTAIYSYLTDALFGEFLLITPRSGWHAVEMMVNVSSNQDPKTWTDAGLNITAWAAFVTLSTASTPSGLQTASNNKMRMVADSDSTNYYIKATSTDIQSTSGSVLQNAGQWQKIAIVRASSTTIGIYVNDTLMTTRTVTISTIGGIVIGFESDYDGDVWTSGSTRYQMNGVPLKASGVAVYGSALQTTKDNSLASGTQALSAAVTAYQAQLTGYSFSYASVGSDTARSVCNGVTSDMSGLTRAQQLMASSGGIVWARTDGTVLFMYADALYPQTSLLTIGTESHSSDRMDTVVFKRAAESRSTRVTVTSSMTSATAVDSVTESAQMARRDPPTISTNNATYADAMSIAWAGMTFKNSLRIDLVSLDLVSASTDLTATLLSTSGTTGALFPTQRVTISVPSAVLGVTTKDVHLQGWTITIGQDYAVAQFTCSPATTATVTGGTCVSSTGTGTVIITTDRPWTTVAQAYPMDLDWAGERIRVSAPGGSTSPQTFTCTARGVTGGTAATSHASGTSIDAWIAGA